MTIMKRRLENFSNLLVTIDNSNSVLLKEAFKILRIAGMIDLVVMTEFSETSELK